VAPILKAYARFKAAKLKEAILKETTLTTGHLINNNVNNKSPAARTASEVSIDEVILKRMAETQLCGTFNKSNVCHIL
jgi:hypothetical protein